MKNYEINSEKSIKGFFEDLYVTYNVAFHPDDEIELDSISEEENEHLNKTMIQCFRYCNNNDLDIYQIGMRVQNKEWKRRGIWS
ncbi:hypothetical protein [Limnovirga soli]|uniref:Uncharacterized protein n=1 Tax=Limnovirga soli TaxID=2656915 RepID=A0A8J8FHD9_9BACT|nr:hypothetical protein [Limnovirga soli]NNV57203.1 hypothetical protein [Limnovirga soli]